MTVTTQPLELGRCRAIAFDQGADVWAIVLPGAGYSAQAPLLWYARFAALAAGRNVLVVTDAFNSVHDEPLAWVQERALAAVNHVRGRDPHPLLVAKSLTSLAAAIAAQERLPAIWLTPLVAPDATTISSAVRDGLRAATRPRLLVGGTADDTWDGAFTASLHDAKVVELRDADHSLELKDDMPRSLANLRRVATAMARFMSHL